MKALKYCIQSFIAGSKLNEDIHLDVNEDMHTHYTSNATPPSLILPSLKMLGIAGRHGIETKCLQVKSNLLLSVCYIARFVTFVLKEASYIS